MVEAIEQADTEEAPNDGATSEQLQRWGQCFDKEQPVSWILNGIHTIENTNKGTHRTFRIKTQPKDASFAPGKRVLALLDGADNGEAYRGFAFVYEDGIKVWSSKRTGIFPMYATMLRSLVLGGENSQFYKLGCRLHAEGRCIRCNRRLTVPASIKSGIGPVCAGRS